MGGNKRRPQPAQRSASRPNTAASIQFNSFLACTQAASAGPFCPLHSLPVRRRQCRLLYKHQSIASKRDLVLTGPMLFNGTSISICTFLRGCHGWADEKQTVTLFTIATFTFAARGHLAFRSPSLPFCCRTLVRLTLYGTVLLFTARALSLHQRAAVKTVLGTSRSAPRYPTPFILDCPSRASTLAINGAILESFRDTITRGRVRRGRFQWPASFSLIAPLQLQAMPCHAVPCSTTRANDRLDLAVHLLRDGVSRSCGMLVQCPVAAICGPSRTCPTLLRQRPG